LSWMEVELNCERKVCMIRFSYKIVNGITIYRLLAAPLLVVLILTGRTEEFKWLLALSFLTDAIDGYLARRFKVVSILGSRLDSIADDFTIGAAILGAIVFKKDFLRQEAGLVTLLVGLYILQTVLAVIRYKKISSFHTYSAKGAAVMQAVFLLLLFFLSKPPYTLFYVAAGATIFDLVEEILLVLMLPQWKTDVKGLYWVLKSGRKNSSKPDQES